MMIALARKAAHLTRGWPNEAIDHMAAKMMNQLNERSRP